MLGSSWIAAQLVASREELSSMKLVSSYVHNGTVNSLQVACRPRIIIYFSICSFMECSVHEANMRDIKMHSKFLSENLKGRDRFGNLCVIGRMILSWILRTHLAQDLMSESRRKSRRIFGFHKGWRIFGPNVPLSTPEERLIYDIIDSCF
jgi:hypothetical protein